MDSYGLVTVANNRQLEEMEAKEIAAAQGVSSDPYAHLVDRLSSHMAVHWEAARDAKTKVEMEMLEDLRSREGIYEPEKLAAIRAQGGSEIFMMLTNSKCRAVEGWLLDVLVQPGTRPFGVTPTPVPNLPQEIVDMLAKGVLDEANQAVAEGLHVTPQQVFERARQVADQAKQRMREHAELMAKRQEDVIEDKFVEGEWYDAIDSMVADMVTFHAGILKGPNMRQTRTLQWVRGEDGKHTPQVEMVIQPVWYSPSPFDVFPAANSSGPRDGGIFERIRVRHDALHSCIGVPGFKEDAIRAVLREYPNGYAVDLTSDQQRNELENKDRATTSTIKPFDVIEMNDAVQGSMLLEWGMEPERVPDPEASYKVCAWKIGRFIVRCVLNEDPLGRSPYMTCHFDKVKGQFWGRGVPRIIRDLQGMCNAAARSLSNNMGLASGPLVEVEVTRLAEGQKVTTISPWKIIQTKHSNNTPAPAVRFHDVPSNAAELMAVFTYFAGLADTYCGIQSYDQGVNPRSGAAGTASGLSMLMNASSRQIKRVVKSIDKVIEASAKGCHTYIMLHHDDEDVKQGDAQIRALGSSALLVREQQQMRRAEFLTATMNPIDSQIIGPDGRSELLREVAKGLDLPEDRVVPSRDEVMRRVRQAMMQAIPPNPQAPVGAAPSDEIVPGGGVPPGGMNLVS